MIEAAPGTSACPHCGDVATYARYVSFISNTVTFSDLYVLKISMASLPPKYVTCASCGHVNLFADWKEAQPEKSTASRCVQSSLDQLHGALIESQPPFFPGSDESHDLRLHIFRIEGSKEAAGIPVFDSVRRANLIKTLTAECRDRSAEPVYSYLLGEIERRNCHFESALQQFRNLLANTDHATLASFSRQNIEWCLEGRRHQQKLTVIPVQPQYSSESSNQKAPTPAHKLIASVSDGQVLKRLAEWVNFPDRIMSIQDPRSLRSVASVYSPCAGILVLETDLKAAWPRESGIRDFINDVSRCSGDTPWLLLGDKDATKSRVQEMRAAGFHVSSVDPQHLNRKLFESWMLHGQRRAMHACRQLQKFASH